MSLPPRLQEWVERMDERYGHQVELRLTRNRRTMISLRQVNRNHTRLRMHEKFSEAPENVLDNLTTYLLTRRRNAWNPISAFAGSIPVTEDPTPRPRLAPLTQGRYFNLESELDFVKTNYFKEPPQATITWGSAGRPRRRKRRSIRFGSWHEDVKQVRIHPLLDQEWVPGEFIRYLIYHELCHAVAKPIRDETGRHRVHHPEFKKLERKYPNLSAMEQAGKEIFQRLIQDRQ